MTITNFIAKIFPLQLRKFSKTHRSKLLFTGKFYSTENEIYLVNSQPKHKKVLIDLSL
jgi:hypothetical protein